MKWREGSTQARCDYRPLETESCTSRSGLVRVEMNGSSAREVARYDLGERIRSVIEGPDGALWVLEDGDDARLLRLTPG